MLSRLQLLSLVLISLFLMSCNKPESAAQTTAEVSVVVT